MLAILLCASCAADERRVETHAVRNIAFVSFVDENFEIFAARTDGKTIFDETQITSDVARDSDPSWSPDCSRIVFSSDRSGRSQIYSIRPTGEDITQLTAGEGEARNPAWSPDGKRIAFDVKDPEHGGYAIYVMNADGSEQEMIIGSSNFEPCWSPDGNQIAVSSGGNLGGILVFDTHGLEMDLPMPADFMELLFTFSPKWSPHGNRIMYTQRFYGDEGPVKSDVFLLNVTTGERTRVTDTPGMNTGLDWSPDGTRILITSNRDGNFELYTLSIDGSHPQRLTHSEAHEIMASWSAGS